MKSLDEGPSPQIQFRVSRDAHEKLQALVKVANAQAEEIGLPSNVTVSSLIRHWVEQRLARGLKLTAEDDGEETVTLRYAPNVTAASERLRGTKR